MARWQKELVMIAVVAAAAAVVTPRVLIGWFPRAPQRARPTPIHAPVAAAPVPAPAPAPEISFDEPLPLPRAPASTPSLPRNPIALAAPGIVVRTAHAATLPPSARRPAGLLTRAGGRWRLDLRTLPQPRAALSGVRLQPPGPEAGASAAGYRVVSGDRMGLFDAAGVRPGDVLVAVNGMPLRNPDEALEVLARTRHATHFTLQFARGGSRYTVPVEVLGRPALH